MIFETFKKIVLSRLILVKSSLVFTHKLYQNSIVSKEPHYELNGLGSNHSWGQDFAHPSILALGPTQPLVQWVLGPVLCGEATRAVLTTSPLCSADIKGGVE
jgi:hypothetical protein